MSDRAEDDTEVIAGMERAVSEAKQADKLTFALVLVLGDEGYITYLRTMERAQPKDLREAAGLLLGYATKLANIAEKVEETPVQVVPRGVPS